MLSVSPSFFTAYGLRIRSFVSLAEPNSVSPGEVDVEVIQGTCPLPEDARTRPDFQSIERHSALFFWQDVGCFWVREGRQIIIEPAKGVADHLLRPFLLGAALPVLLLQRGLFILHASAAALRLADGVERAVAFLGHSGQGKSTMATALHRRGHRAMADDTIALPVSKSESPLLHSALPHLKLRAPSIEAFGENAGAFPRWHPDADSFVLRVSPTYEPALLRCFYVLEDSHSLLVEPLSLPEALMILMRHAYSMGLLPDSEMDKGFQTCVQIAQHIPVFKLRRPRDFKRLPDVIRLVEEHQNFLASGSNRNSPENALFCFDQ